MNDLLLILILFLQFYSSVYSDGIEQKAVQEVVFIKLGTFCKFLKISFLLDFLWFVKLATPIANFYFFPKFLYI